MIYFYTTDSN